MAIRIFEMGTLPPGNTTRKGEHLAKQSGTVAGASAQSSALNVRTRWVVIQSDEACHVAFGADPTATTAYFKIAAGETHDFHVRGGTKVAWISA